MSVFDANIIKGQDSESGLFCPTITPTISTYNNFSLGSGSWRIIGTGVGIDGGDLINNAPFVIENLPRGRYPIMFDIDSNIDGQDFKSHRRIIELDLTQP